MVIEIVVRSGVRYDNGTTAWYTTTEKHSHMCNNMTLVHGEGLFDLTTLVYQKLFPLHYKATLCIV